MPDDPSTSAVVRPLPVPDHAASASSQHAANPDAARPYVFGGEIARGGMGSVLQADDCKLGRAVAVKVMLGEAGADEPQRRRFINEAAILGMLEHPNIVPIHDLGRDAQGQLFYTMKLVKGHTLQAILSGLREGVESGVGILPTSSPEDRGKMPLPQYTLDRLLTVFRKVCDAMAFAHSRGIIHRDLKPENIMVGEFGEVLVMDWGLAKRLGGQEGEMGRRGDTETAVKISHPMSTDADAETLLVHHSNATRQDALRQLAADSDTGSHAMTLEGDVMGTPQYMSPEQAEGRIAEMDVRSDIYSLGAILYAILAHRPPVEGATAQEVLQKVSAGGVTPLKATAAAIPPALAAVTLKALSVKREARYPTVTALAVDVEAYQNGFATSAENAGLGRQFALFIKRHKAASLGVAAVLLVGATLGAKALVEGQRAARALADLKTNAPAMLALAESEAVAQRFPSELEKTDAALRLDPGLLPAYWRRAWCLVALGRFPEAVAALRTAGERDPAHVRQLGGILPQIEKIAAISDEGARYAPDLLTPVFEFLNAHAASGEAGALVNHLRLTNGQHFALAQERLKALGGSTAVAAIRLEASGLIVLNYGGAKLNSLDQVRGIPCDILNADSGQFESLESLRGLRLIKLNLLDNRISDISPLRGMSLVDLNLMHNHGISDLSPLAGMPLRRLSLIYCEAVRDLSPLHGMPLEELNLLKTSVDDLRPLAGAPLEKLDLSSTHVSGLSPLVGMPLKDLDISNCFELRDLSPLLRIPTLERLVTNAPPEMLNPLRRHPRLAHINYQGKGYRPAAEVWAELDAQKAAAKKP